MTTNDELEFDDDTATGGDGNAMKAVRAELAKVKRDRDAANAELLKLQTAAKTTTIADALKVHGAKPGLAKFAATGIEGEVTPESVLEWLTENGPDLGWEPAEVEEADGPAANARRISNAADNAPAAKSGWTSDRIASAPDEELIAAGIINKR